MQTGESHQAFGKYITLSFVRAISSCELRFIILSMQSNGASQHTHLQLQESVSQHTLHQVVTVRTHPQKPGDRHCQRKG